MKYIHLTITIISFIVFVIYFASRHYFKGILK